jgi:hypothetical protein
MSTGNILAILPAGEDAIDVVFLVRGAEGSRTYRYTGAAAVAILAGSDPGEFDGVRVA